MIHETSVSSVSSRSHHLTKEIHTCKMKWTLKKETDKRKHRWAPKRSALHKIQSWIATGPDSWTAHDRASLEGFQSRRISCLFLLGTGSRETDQGDWNRKVFRCLESRCSQMFSDVLREDKLLTSVYILSSRTTPPQPQDDSLKGTFAKSRVALKSTIASSIRLPGWTARSPQRVQPSNACLEIEFNNVQQQ